MSTTYELYSNGDDVLEVTERSSKLNIEMNIDSDQGISINNLTPLQIQDIVIKLVECASYSSEDATEYFIDTIELLAEKRNINLQLYI